MKIKNFATNNLASFSPAAIDVEAGPIWDNDEAQEKCKAACASAGREWNGQWRTTQFGRMSVCGCAAKAQGALTY